MPGGKPATWAARLRSLDVRFVRSVLNVWPRCLRVLPDRPEEDVITFNLVQFLRKDPLVREWFHLVAFRTTRRGTSRTVWPTARDASTWLYCWIRWLKGISRTNASG